MAWLERVQDEAAVSPAGVSLALAIARHLNKRTGVAFPSQATLAAKVGVKERQVRNLLRQLESSGLLAVESGGFQRPDVYRPTIPDRQCVATISPATECRSKTGNPASPVRQSSDRVTGNGLPPNLLSEPLREPVLDTQELAEGDSDAVEMAARLIEKAKVDLDPTRVVLACQSHHGDLWQAKLKTWTLGAIARAPRKPEPVLAIYDGPVELRVAVAANRGEPYTASYFDQCRWREEDRTLLARNEFAARRLIEDLGRDWLRARELSIGVAAANDAIPSDRREAS